MFKYFLSQPSRNLAPNFHKVNRKEPMTNTGTRKSIGEGFSRHENESKITKSVKINDITVTLLPNATLAH